MKVALFVGLDAPKLPDVRVLHVPLIQIVPRPDGEIAQAFQKHNKATHIIMTSKSTVRCCKKYLDIKKQFISVGKATTGALNALGSTDILTAANECQEGIIELLDTLPLQNPFFFWPHSSRSRPILKNYFEEKGHPYFECLVYDTHFIAPQVPLDFQSIDEIHFTSPSCVEAFLHFFGPPPKHIQLHTKGAVTHEALCQIAVSDMVII